MKQSTIKKYMDILSSAEGSNQSLSKFCKEHGINYASVVCTISALKKQNDQQTDDIKNLLRLYGKVTKAKETVDTDDRADISYVRDEDGKICCYKYQIYRKDRNPLCGNLSRDEMNSIHRLYSYYGDSLTQRVISRHFVDLSLIDFKRILRAFNITKASAPFAPHMIEEFSEEELREIQLREKENSFLRKAEEDQIRNNERLLRKYASENLELKKILESRSEIKVVIPDDVKPTIIEKLSSSEKSINIYLADLHIGASVTSGVMYSENIDYGFLEAKRRLTEVIRRLKVFGCFDKVNIVLMGDNIDCPGIYGKTARLDHSIPENMDAREQINRFIELMMWFIGTLADKNNELCSSISVYSVPCGNHGGNAEYICNKALMASINAMFPNISTSLWEEFFGIFEHNKHIFICCHGK